MTESVMKALLFVLFGICAIEDCRAKSIRGLWVVTGITAGLILRLISGGDFLRDILPGMIPGAVMLLSAFASRQAVGYGDGMLILISGICLGFFDSLTLLLISLALGALLSVILVAAGKKKWKDPIPFVPFLLAGLAVLEMIRI